MTQSQIDSLKREVSNTFKSMDKVEELIVNLVIDHLAATGRLMPEWMPIEAAPKDGSAILIHTINGVEIARYRKSAWVVFDCADDFYSHEYNIEYPTHWMPLPEPPQERKTK